MASRHSRGPYEDVTSTESQHFLSNGSPPLWGFLPRRDPTLPIPWPPTLPGSRADRTARADEIRITWSAIVVNRSLQGPMSQSPSRRACPPFGNGAQSRLQPSPTTADTAHAMRIVLVAFGSRGDVQPLVALGMRLRDHGHEVVIGASRGFADWVRGNGLGFHAVGNDIEAWIRKNGQALVRSPARLLSPPSNTCGKKSRSHSSTRWSRHRAPP